MGKSFKGFSKALSLILAVAMVVTCVPTSAYAAELLSVDESEDLLIGGDSLVEESSDALVTDDASASEEKSSSLIDTQKEADLAAAPEENTAGEEEIVPDQAKADVALSFGVSSYQDTDGNSYHAGIFAYNDLSVSTRLNATGTTASTYNPYVKNDEKVINIDSEKDYTFIVEPTEGYAFDLTGNKALVAGSYVDYSTKAVGEVKQVAVDGTNLKVEELTDVEKPYYFKGSKKVTINKTVFANVLAGKDDKTTTDDDGILTLSFPTNASAAKWTVSGFELKDIEQDPEALPSDLELENGTDKVLELTKVLKCGSLDVANFAVHVLLFDKDGELLIDSGVLSAGAYATTNLGTPDATDITDWSKDAGSDHKQIWALYNTDGEVLIHGNAISYAYNYDCDLVVDVTAGSVGDVTIKATADAVKAADFTALDPSDVATIQSGATTPEDANAWTGTITTAGIKNTGHTAGNLYFDVTPTTASKYNYVHSVTWTVNGESDDAYDAKVDPASASWQVKIPQADLAEGDIVVSVTGAYSVTKKTADSTYTILDLEGLPVGQAEGGKDFKFQIAPILGKKVNSVTYQVGGGESKSIRPEGGVFTIPKEQLKDSVTILPSMSASGAGDAIVRLADAYSGIHVYKLDDQSAGMSPTEIDKAGKATTMGEPVRFIIDEGSTIIESVSYSMGTAKDVVITPAFGKTYEIPAVNDTEAIIKITYRAAGEVYAPFNEKVTVNFAKNGEKITVPTGSFSFTVTPVSSNIKVTKIYVNGDNDNASGALPGTDGGTVNIAAGTQYVYVETEEAVPATDFRAVFGDSIDPTLIETKYEEGKPKNILNIKEQDLNLVLNSGEQTITSEFYPVKNDKLRAKITPTEGVKITAPETTDVLTLDKANVKITPKKAGNQDVVISAKDAVANSFGNFLVYNGTLKVSVKQPYTDLAIVADQNSAYTYAGDGTSGYNSDNLDYVGFTLTGKDGQTGDPTIVNVDGTIVKSVAWSFVPSTDQVKPADYKYAFDDASTGHAFAVASGATGATGATAYVTAKEAGAVTVKAVITYKDNSEEEVTKTINFIDPLTKTYFLTRTINGCVDDWSLEGATVVAKKDAGIIGLNSDNKSFNIKYDVYSIEDPSVTTTSQYDTKAEVEALLKDNKIAKVENAVFGEAKIVNALAISSSNDYVLNKKDTGAYATLSGTAADGYTITAVKSNEGLETRIIGFATPEITIDGVIVPDLNATGRDVYFAVADKVAMNKVELITIDDQSYNEAGTARLNKEQTLSTAYIDGRDYSVVKDSTDPRNVKNIGIEFNSIGDSTFITLPKESDLDASKIVAKKTLLGWAEASYNPNGPGAVIPVGGGNNTAKFVYKPGEPVQITGDVSFKAIYSDKYVKYTGTNGDSTGELIRLYDKSKSYVDDKNEVKYPVVVPLSPNTVEIGDVVPVVIGVGKVDGFAAGAYDTVLKTVDIDNLTVKEEFYEPADFKLTAKGADSTALLDATELGKGSIKSKSDTTRTGVDAVITASWKDKERTADEYTEDKTVAFAASTVDDDSLEITGPTGFISSDDTATINEGAIPVDLASDLIDSVVDPANAINLLAADGTLTNAYDAFYYNYKYVWSSSKPTVATVTAGENEKQGTATLTPLAAGNTTIKLSVLKSGKEIASDEFELTVTASDVVLTFADNEGHTGITQVEAHAAATNNGVFKVKATDKSGKAITGGTFTFGVSTTYENNKVIADDQYNLATGAGDANGFTSVNVKTKDFVGTDVLHVVFTNTVSGKTYTYQKDINVKTYYSIDLTPVANTWITVNGVKQANADGTSKPVEVKLFEEDMKDVAENAASKVAGKVKPLKKKNFNFKDISLNGYSAIYDDGTTAEKEFSNWQVNQNTATSPNLNGTEYKENDTIKSLIGYKYVDGTTANDKTAFGTTSSKTGRLVMNPEVADVVELAGVPGQITMNYKASDVVSVGGHKSIDKKVSFTVEPNTFASTFSVEGTKAGFYAIYDDASHTNADETVTASSGKSSFVIAAYYDYDADTKTTWAAGTDKLSIYGPNKSTALATITLDINGLNYDASTKKVQYFENGQTIKSDYRTVDGNTYYFDAEGNWIETTGITKINGKSVMIVNGVVAPKGKNVFEGNTYFVGDNGVILTGWLTNDGAAATAANGVYYADPAADGKLVSGLQTIDGKKFFFTSDNKKAVASSSANLFENVSGTDYYVNATGDIAMNGIFKVAGVDRLFKEDGKIVTYADTTDGKITVGGITYIVDKVTNEAKRDDIFYAAKVNWTKKFDTKFTKGSAAPVLKYTITYTSANTGSTATTEELSVVATTSDDFSAASTATKVTFTAAPDLTGYFVDKEGKTPATASAISTTYNFKNGGAEGTSGEPVAEGFSIEGLEEEYYFTGAAIKPAFTVTDDERGVILAKGVDYSVSYKNNTKIGKDTAQITVKGKGNYQGQAKIVTFSIVDPVAAAKEAGEELAVTVKKVNKITQAFTYNGEPQWPDSVVVETKDAGTITMKHDGNGKYSSEGDKSVAISVANNVEKGSATVTAIGSDNKAKKTTFKIAAVDLSAASTDDLTITAAAAKYTSKGATTTVEVSYKGLDLIEGQDYTVKYAYANKKNAGENAGNVTITGKGNFAKAAAAVPFEIEKFSFTTDLADGFATTAVAGAKPKAIKATVVDLAGNVIPAKAYKLTVEDAESKDITSSTTKLNAGDAITVKIEAVDTTNYEGDASVSITVAPDIKKVKYNKKYEKTFTGEAITLEAEDFEKMAITLNGTTLEAGTDFVVVGYAKNVKKGTAQVTIAGASDKAAGTVVLKFKIVAKTIK